MRKHPLRNVLVALAILSITLSLTAVLPATGQEKSLIISKLQQLNSMLEGEHVSLQNKVNAVIHQIEAGAYHGAINKLQNDVKKSIIAWVPSPEELLKLVDEIINLIKGIHPPTPDFELEAIPDEITILQGNSGTVTIIVRSETSFNKSVTLSVTSPPIVGIVTDVNPSQVTPPPNGTANATLTTNVAVNATPTIHEIVVTGTSESLPTRTVTISVKISTAVHEDTIPPVIANVLRNPEDPAYTENVTITALVYDNQSGVRQVQLNYTVGTQSTIANMTVINGLYSAIIPKFAFNTTVQYRVTAMDNTNNTATSDVFTYTVTDPIPPVVRIIAPSEGSYLAGEETIQVTMKDDDTGGSGFGTAELSINSTIVKTWDTEPSMGADEYPWNTTSLADGVYTIVLMMTDRAGNNATEAVTVTVDNTLPFALINLPISGAQLRLTTLIQVTGTDLNFDRMEVSIDDTVLKTFTQSGLQTVEWDTRNTADGVHSLSLTVYDRAGNGRKVSINVTVDNTPPEIGAPTWSPTEPAANVDIQINVSVTEPAGSSGVQNVTLAYKNTTMDDWKFVPMQLAGRNWTATLTNQSDTDVRFYIEAFDVIGNSDMTTVKTFTVAAPTGLPLAWILAAVAIIAAAVGGTAYYLQRKRRPPATAAAPSATPTKA